MNKYHLKSQPKIVRNNLLNLEKIVSLKSQAKIVSLKSQANIVRNNLLKNLRKNLRKNQAKIAINNLQKGLNAILKFHKKKTNLVKMLAK